MFDVLDFNNSKNENLNNDILSKFQSIVKSGLKTFKMRKNKPLRNAAGRVIDVPHWYDEKGNLFYGYSDKAVKSSIK